MKLDLSCYFQSHSSTGMVFLLTWNPLAPAADNGSCDFAKEPGKVSFVRSFRSAITHTRKSVQFFAP